MRVTGLGFTVEGYGPDEDYGDGAWVTAGGYDTLFGTFVLRTALFALRPGSSPAAAIPRLLGLAFGIPLGLALGRVVWRLVADSTPLQYVPPVPVLALAVIVPLALLIANLLAALPGRRAASLPVNQILRAE